MTLIGALCPGLGTVREETVCTGNPEKKRGWKKLHFMGIVRHWKRTDKNIMGFLQ